MRKLKKVIFPVILFLGIYYAFFSGEYSWFSLRELRSELARTQIELDEKREEIDSLVALNDSVRSDLGTLERIARERFGMIKDGETIYRFAEPTNSLGSASDPIKVDRH